MAQETVERFDPAKELPIITHGLPYPEACAKHLGDTLHCSRPFLVISNSLSKSTDAIGLLKAALGRDDVALAGVHIGMKPHTYYSEVLQIAREVKDSGADSIITVGGGSLIDGAKAISLALANGVTTHDELDHLLRASPVNQDQGAQPPPAGAPRPASLPIMSVTTTLSAGEFNPAGGATNDATRHKQSFRSPPPAGGGSAGGVSVVVMDPALARTTPARVWLSTGLRALDHCVETVCSSNPSAAGTAHSLRGARLLVPGLLRARAEPGDGAARLRCQLGAAESMKAMNLYGVRIGGSHGIGHQLGPLGVPHAETTCVCLPAVQKFNARANAAQQRVVLDALWAEPEVAAVLEGRGLARGDADLGDALDAVIRELGFPRTLGHYGIGRGDLEAIAESSLRDVCCRWNVIPLETKGQVLEILEMCLGDQ